MITKIAVLRANALGDFIFVIPALYALRERFRDAEIVYLGKPWHKELLENRPFPVNRVEVVPDYPGVSREEGFIPGEAVLNDFFTRMQQEKFDLAFQLHGGGRNSNPFVLRLGAKKTVGLATKDATPLGITVPYIYYTSEILRYLEVVGKVGAVTAQIAPRFPALQSDIDNAISVLPQARHASVAVIHPGATDVRRRWPAINFSRIADFLVKEGYTVFVTGQGQEKQIIDAVRNAAAYPDRIIDACNISIRQLTGLLAMAEIVVSNDTGPLHLARALGRRNAGIFWCGNVITAMSVTTEWNRSLISWMVSCPLCGLPCHAFDTVKNGCLHRVSFVDTVTVDEVLENVRDLLKI